MAPQKQATSIVEWVVKGLSCRDTGLRVLVGVVAEDSDGTNKYIRIVSGAVKAEEFSSIVKVGQKVALVTPNGRIFGDVLDIGPSFVTVRGRNSKYTEGDFFVKYGQIQSIIIPTDSSGILA